MIALLFAAVSLAAPFRDGCVLQRDRPVAVWGTAASGEEVRVRFAGQDVRTAADKDGKWKVTLSPMASSREGRILQANDVQIRDVLVGEVWLAAGQSNMAFALYSDGPRNCDRNAGLVAQLTRREGLRLARVPARKSDVPLADADVRWFKAVPENLFGGRAFSAVGFYFGKTLEEALDVPVGIVETSVGATSIDSWIPKDEFAAFAPSKRAGNEPQIYFNGMAAAVLPYTARGFIWYQGERNSDPIEWPQYTAKLHALLDGWRRVSGNPDLTMRFVQLAPWGRETVPETQCQQAQFVAEEPAAKMCVVNDVANLHDIHPNDKEPVGRRLAALALKHDYGWDIVADSPAVTGWRSADGKARLSVACAKRLYVCHPDWMYRTDTKRTSELGFELSGADGVWKPAEILNLRRTVTSRDPLTAQETSEFRGELEGGEIVLRADGVPSPVAVRYLFKRPWRGSVYNEAGLPMGAFRFALPTTGTVEFPAGPCRMSAADAPRKCFYVSNHDHLPQRPVVFPVEGATNLVIRGAGTRLVIDGDAVAFVFRNCKDVRLEGFDIDWTEPYCREAVITSLSSDETRFRMVDPYRPQGKCIVRMFRGDTREMVSGVGEVYLDGDAVPCGNGEWSLKHDFSKDGAGARVGDVLAFRPLGRPNPAIFAERATGLAVSNVTVRTAWGMAFLVQCSEDVSWSGGGVRPRQGHYASTHADATHFSNVGGMVRVENAHFEGMMDDAINVHSTCLGVEEVIGARSIRCRYRHGQAIGFDIFRAGDVLRFVRGDTLDRVGEAKVASVSRLSPREIVLTLAKPVPAGISAGDVIEDADLQCAAVFRGNTVTCNRARGALFTTPKKVVIEDNVFDRSTSSALLFSGDAGSWYESGACTDVTIRGNTFRNCMLATPEGGLSRAIIAFNPVVTRPEAAKGRYHSNIVIAHNRFETFEAPVLYATSVSGLVFRANAIVPNRDYPPRKERRRFIVENSDDVKVEEP